MKIAVISSNGKSAKMIIAEALRRGFDVTGFGRGDNKSEVKNYVKKDIFDITFNDLKDFDAVVDCAGGWTQETYNVIPDAGAHLCKILSGSEIRLLIVGGAGSLFVNSERTQTVADLPNFPDSFKGVATAHQTLLNNLRKTEDVKWTYISPAADFQAEGKRSGKYILAGEDFTLNTKGESVISYADYAIAMIDEIEKGSHIKERISVIGE